MGRHRALLAHRRARFLQDRRVERGLAEDDELRGALHYRDWLLRNSAARGRGAAMRRALIQAEHRYAKLNPTRIRTSRLHRAYARKTQGRSR